MTGEHPLRTLVVIGTRPEAVKMAPVFAELSRRVDEFEPILVITGQHSSMLDQVLEIFDLVPQIDLDLMTPDQSLAALTGRALAELDTTLDAVRPDVVLVQGDTTTALCGALAAYYHRVSVGHIEGGLRTNDKFSPFPEEMNRQLIGRLADLHFTPTRRATEALLAEGVAPERIVETGNPVVDALLWIRNLMRERPPRLPEAIPDLDQAKLVLVTGHRRESFGPGLRNICCGIRDVAMEHPDAMFLYAVHLNPQVKGPVNEILGDIRNVVLTEPLPYDAFVYLMDKATVILTDSGGVQEEAPSFGKPVLITREVTERIEGLKAGTAELVGFDRDRIATRLGALLLDPKERGRFAATNPYGDGKAASRIADAITERFTNQDGSPRIDRG